MAESKVSIFLRSFVDKLHAFGIDLRRVIQFKYYSQYRKDRYEWRRLGGKITKHHMVLSDYRDVAGTAKGHYFHQDLLVARLVFEDKPKRHVDIGSRVDGFVAHVAAFREIEILDVRPLESSKHRNIKYHQADLMCPQDLGEIDSLSCLHVIEHFGLGRYTDKIDVQGHIKGITNLVELVSLGGRLYISFPISDQDEVHFNAHRVFNPRSILQHPSIKNLMHLIRFDYVDDDGDLHLNKNIQDLPPGMRFSCGIYTFEKIK